MIQATDLRIGNYYLLNSRVIELDEELMYEIFTPYTGASLASLEPIPLSPEVLEACGFEKQTGDYSKDSVVYSNGIRLYQHEDNEYSLYGYNERRVYISYVHELQNLFVLLMGTELTINLEQVKV